MPGGCLRLRPWIRRLYPDIRYIFWIRNPRDCILGGHLTDDLADFGIPYPPTDDERLRRAISWKYQYDLVKATPKPEHWIEVRNLSSRLRLKVIRKLTELLSSITYFGVAGVLLLLPFFLRRLALLA